MNALGQLAIVEWNPAMQPRERAAALEFRYILDTGWKNWHQGSDDSSIADRMYHFAQERFRAGVPMDWLARSLEEWRTGRQRSVDDNADRYCAFLRHFLIRGYQDAIR